MNEHKYTNNLIKETSPYLLQHAHNPVDWYAWGDEALSRAKEEDKPILVSIGYSACHWCHVMERESFEDEDTAAIMNRAFINIKIDREERPDIDHIYMDAVQAITGSGGWPLNVFLTPDLKPFFGGTYFPPARAFNRSSWKEVLMAVTAAYNDKRDEINAQAENLTQYLLNTNIINSAGGDFDADKTLLNTISFNILKTADKEWGGFGQAPKFPQTFSIVYLLRHYYLTKDEASLKAALLSLDKMMMGGIYDHIGGGFCRYSTDGRWQIPHFEKMLYDNALLIDALTEAYQLTKNEDYANVVRQTIQFIKRELTAPGGGFYSALDADSEGTEGKYYTWGKQEIDELLKDNSALFHLAYDISESGNWEHTNIIWMPESIEKVASKTGMNKDALEEKLGASRQILFNAQQKRVKPGLDNKVLTGWNALAITSLCNAYAALGEEEYLNMAIANINFIENNLFDGEGNLLHSWNQTAKPQQAFLDDYAALIQAYIFLQQSTADNNYLLKAKALAEQAIEFFSDENAVLFYFASKTQHDIPLRKIELYDGATPSGNALMAENLLKLSILFYVPEWKNRAAQMLQHIKALAEKYPTSFGVWNLTFQAMISGLKEIAIVGKDSKPVLLQLLKEYAPFKIIQASENAGANWPLLAEKFVFPNETYIYICENYRCFKPLKNFAEFKNQLDKIF